MDEHKDGFRRVIPCSTAGRIAAILVVFLALHTATANAAGSERHFELEAGDAPIMLNEFSRQSDMQVLFDFNILKGMKTRAVTGDFETSDALTAMLKGTNLGFDFVNERTLAVTPKKPSMFSKLFHHPKTRSKHGDDDGLEQVLISGADGNTGT